MFITFEGPEGGGKSTQARLLAERLHTTGYPVALTREPGGTPAGKAIRAIWDDPARSDLLPITDLLLLCADRAQHVGSLIRPALERGEIVISDRYADSTRAYQGYGSGLDVDVMETLLQIATGGLTPDLTLLLDIPAAEGLARRHSASQSGASPLDRLDQRSLEYHERVHAGYLKLAAQEPARWVTLDARTDLKTLSERIWQIVQARLAQLPHS
ncbi:MAG TPA: dTMP kinase [Ktedonobacterales bacterium]|nr:dTMP kinase [Ktedonobacterales bacterium]